MPSRIRSIMITAAAIVAASLVLQVPATAVDRDVSPVTRAAEIAPDAGPCYWITFGKNSNCDGAAPGSAIWAQCTGIENGEYLVYNRQLGNVGWIALYYSPKCRTVGAGISVTTTPPAGSNCYVKVQRNSDGKAFRESWQKQDTALLYDADVTSYAWGYCKWGTNPPVTAQTPNW